MSTSAAVASRPSAAVAGPAPGRPGWQAGFLELLPEIESRLRFAFHRLSAEAKEEAIQEATCNACRAYARLAAAGRAEVATAGSLARYAAAQCRAGRRVGGPLNVDDVCSEHCRLRKGVAVERLDVAAGGIWREALVEDRTVTPAELAASRIDYPAFLGSLSERDRSIAERLAAGEPSGAVADLFGLSVGRVSQLRRELYAAWLRFHGDGGPRRPAAVTA